MFPLGDLFRRQFSVCDHGGHLFGRRRAAADRSAVGLQRQAPSQATAAAGPGPGVPLCGASVGPFGRSCRWDMSSILIHFS